MPRAGDSSRRGAGTGMVLTRAGRSAFVSIAGSVLAPRGCCYECPQPGRSGVRGPRLRSHPEALGRLFPASTPGLAGTSLPPAPPPLPSVHLSPPPPVCLLYKGQKSLDVGPTCVIGGDRVSRTFTEYPPRPFSQTPRCSRLFHRSGCGYIFLRAGFRPPTDAENRYLKTCLLLLGRLIRSVCSAHSKACCDCGEVTLTARRWGCSASVRGMSPLGSHRFMSSHVLWF